MIAKFGTKYLFKLWNPFHMTDENGNRIRDIKMRRRSARLSAKIREERRFFNLQERKTHKCAITRSLELSDN